MRPLLFITLLSTFLFADISVFISHNNKLTKISTKELANLYLKKKTTINGIKVVPIDSKNKELFNEFYKKIVKKTPKQLHAYWIKEIYKGKKQPPKKLSKAELHRAMKKNSHIISYAKIPLTGRILLTIK